MAEHIGLGVDSNPKCQAIVRSLPEVSCNTEQTAASLPTTGATYVDPGDLESCRGLIVGSPGYFGNMAAPVKYFFDQTSSFWLSGALIDKPAAVFTSTSSMHGGQESVLLSMMLPLLHHGMLISGIPYSEKAIHRTRTGGTPYGASHVASEQGQRLSQDEIICCQTLGKRVAHIVVQMNA